MIDTRERRDQAGAHRERRVLTALALLCVLSSLTASAQPAPAFEAASIKRQPPGPVQGGGIQYLPGGRYVGTKVTVSQLLSAAFPGIRGTLLDVAGAPDWIYGEYYEVIATAGRDATRAEMGMMMRTLLEQRFQLRARLERQDRPIWELVLARSDGRLGPQIKPFEHVCGQAGAPRCGVTAGRGGVTFVGVPVSRLTTFFTASVGRHMVDRTGLTGLYEFNLVYKPETGRPRDPEDERPDVFVALQEQLGLKLQSARGTVEVLVIDRIERPSEN